MNTPQIASFQESKSLFDRYLQAKVEKLERNASMRVEVPRCSLDAKLQKLLPRLQRSIVEQIKMLRNNPHAVSSHSPPFSWLRESVKLQNFYCSLRHVPATVLIIGACVDIREEADAKVCSLLTSRNSLSNEERELIQREILADAWKRIGEIAFRLDWKTEDPEVILQKSWESLIVRSKIAEAHGLQPVDQVFISQLPKEIAKLLLTSQGQLNLGMIKSIESRFFPETRSLTESEKGIVFVLDRIDSSWQKFFDEIKVPCNAVIPSNALIRAELGLLPDEKITQLHCQQVALAALLSQLSNKKVGECLTMAWMLKRLPEFFLESLKDYTEIIHLGYLTRRVDGKIDTFFFENAFADRSLSEKITLKKNKHVLEFSGAPFWKCPQLISACRQMGIEDLEARKEMLLNQIAPIENGEKQVTWDKLIRSCAKSVENSKHSTEDLIALGRYGFSLSVNRLLKAWETCLAGAVDYSSDSSIRVSINETVMSVFAQVFKKETSYYERTLIKEMKSNVEDVLDDSFRLIYNEAIPLPYAFQDGRFTCSGFKLFQRDLKDFSHQGTRIETPAQFRTFILGVIDAFSVPKEGVISSPVIIDELQECVLHEDFVKRVICHYDIENTTVSDPVKKYDHLGQTPMTSLCDDYCPDHLVIDSFDHFNPNIRSVFLKNHDGLLKLSKPKELLKWMLNLPQFSKEIFYSEVFATGQEFQSFLSDIPSSVEKSTFDKVSAPGLQQAKPMSRHMGDADSCKDGDAGAVKSEVFNRTRYKMGAEEWIQKMILDPGLMVSRAKMCHESKLKYQKRVKGFLGEPTPGRTPRSRGRMEAFFKDINADGEGMTIKQFAQRSYEGLLHIFKNEGEVCKAMELMLDSFLLESLPDDKLHAIQESAVRFAEIEGSPLFFCCFFNPRTEQLELGSMNENKTDLKSIGAHEWQEKAKR